MRGGWGRRALMNSGPCKHQPAFRILAAGICDDPLVLYRGQVGEGEESGRGAARKGRGCRKEWRRRKKERRKENRGELQRMTKEGNTETFLFSALSRFYFTALINLLVKGKGEQTMA